jgi:hypothetical protein
VINFTSYLLLNLILEYRNVFNSVNFTASGQFVNPTRDNTTVVSKEEGRLVVFGTKRSAVLITTGLISSCNVVEPTYHQDNRVKRVQLFPLAYEYERLLGWFGSIFGRSQLYGNVTPDVALTFSTRKEGAGSQGKSTSHIPS